MKKRKEWITKALKRSKKKMDRGIVDLMMIMYHFFKKLPSWIDEMTDPRHQAYNLQPSGSCLYGLTKKYVWSES